MSFSPQRFLLTAAVLLLATSCAPARMGREKTSYVRYRGAWFTVDYPAGWKAVPPSRRSIGGAGPDTAQFTSSDGSVAFYIFAPLWNGDPKIIAIDRKREQFVSHRVNAAPRIFQGNGHYLYNPVANWYTVRAKDHSYQRSWVDVEDKGLNVRHVFGIKYRAPLAYQKYRVQYLHFCKSLEQFSD